MLASSSTACRELLGLVLITHDCTTPAAKALEGTHKCTYDQQAMFPTSIHRVHSYAGTSSSPWSAHGSAFHAGLAACKLARRLSSMGPIT